MDKTGHSIMIDAPRVPVLQLLLSKGKCGEDAFLCGIVFTGGKAASG